MIAIIILLMIAIEHYKLSPALTWGVDYTFTNYNLGD